MVDNHSTGLAGHSLDQNGLFIYKENPTIISIRAVLKFLFRKNPQRLVKKKDTWRITVRKNESWLNDPADKIVWLGHASFFIQLSGIRLLTDPVFGKLPIVKRYSELPVPPDRFLNIDYILISHAHYDHCDRKSIKLLSANNPNTKILADLKLDKLISKWVKNPIHTAGVVSGKCRIQDYT